MRIAVMDENKADGTRMAALIRDACCRQMKQPDHLEIAQYNDCLSFTRAFCETGFDILFVAIYGIRDFEAAWRIREMDRRIPIVAISGDEEYASASWRINVTDYLVRPVKPDDLRHSVARIFDRQPQLELCGNLLNKREERA